jgi:hypothetical protein
MRDRWAWLLLACALVFSVTIASATAPTTLGGLTPMPNDARVPTRFMPPGSFDDDPGPSDVIFPAQELTIRFNHKLHIGEQHRQCKNCHPGAYTSNSTADELTPKGLVCDNCHLSDHTNLAKVEPGGDEMGKCAFCHVGYKDGDGNKVADFVIPRANMVFSHQKHTARNINCGQCHGNVEELELATRDQLPRMRGCFGCHQQPDAVARGDAKGACDTCHLRGGPREGNVIRTMFAQGTLQPPRWLHNAEHGPDFIERHRRVAGGDSEFCANCHKEDFCTDCHDGRVRPRRIHPNDYLNMHPVDARMASERCTSCHREQSFCVDCHLRVGVGESSPSGVKSTNRFHPPQSVWSGPIRMPGHHAFEAQRNMNACVSCHIERDCVACHGGSGTGAGYNIHPAGFLSSCGMQMRRNPRPCFVCHQPSEIAPKCQ